MIYDASPFELFEPQGWTMERAFSLWGGCRVLATALGSSLFIVPFKVYLPLLTCLFGLQITEKVVLKPPICNSGFTRDSLSSCQSFPLSTTLLLDKFVFNLLSWSWRKIQLVPCSICLVASSREARVTSVTAHSSELCGICSACPCRNVAVQPRLCLCSHAPSTQNALAPLFSILVTRDLIFHPLLNACLQLRDLFPLRVLCCHIPFGPPQPQAQGPCGLGGQ